MSQFMPNWSKHVQISLYLSRIVLDRQFKLVQTCPNWAEIRFPGDGCDLFHIPYINTIGIALEKLLFCYIVAWIQPTVLDFRKIIYCLKMNSVENKSRYLERQFSRFEAPENQAKMRFVCWNQETAIVLDSSNWSKHV